MSDGHEPAKKILDVGQCGFDGPAVRKLLRDRLGAEVTSAPTADAADRRLGEDDYDLILVNRVFAGDDASGLDWIGQYDGKVPIMLVSDREDAQDAAVELGAVRGFGKSRLRDDATIDLVRRAMGGE